jgi:hypothetical protein
MRSKLGEPHWQTMFLYRYTLTPVREPDFPVKRASSQLSKEYIDVVDACMNAYIRYGEAEDLRKRLQWKADAEEKEFAEARDKAEQAQKLIPPYPTETHDALKNFVRSLEFADTDSTRDLEADETNLLTIGPALFVKLRERRVKINEHNKLVAEAMLLPHELHAAAAKAADERNRIAGILDQHIKQCEAKLKECEVVEALIARLMDVQ